MNRKDTCTVLVPTRDGEACITVSPEFLSDGRLTVQPIRRDGDYVVVHTPTRFSRGRREPIARQWIPAALVREELALHRKVITARRAALAQLEMPDAVRERQDPRVPTPALVAGGSSVVRDISRGGIGLAYEVGFIPGGRYRIALTDILIGETQSLPSEAVWCRGGKAGLRWVGLEPEQRRWLLRYIPDRVSGRVGERESG